MIDQAIQMTQTVERDRLLKASVTTNDWTVDVFLARGYTGCYYACSTQAGEERGEQVCCGNLDLAVKKAMQFVYENIWENM